MKEWRHGYFYFLTNKNNRVIYAGVTSNLIKRIFEHKNKLVSGFTQQYNVTKLVYYECFDAIDDAILREKQVKGWLRAKKVALIHSKNPEWNDLYPLLI